MTGWTQTIYYSLTIRAGDPRPQPNTPRWAEHRRRIHVLVVGAYLLYTLYEADHDLRRASDFYHDLGVPPAATEREIKARFRRLAALHHPDKAPPGAGTDGMRRIVAERGGPLCRQAALACVEALQHRQHAEARNLAEPAAPGRLRHFVLASRL